MNRTDQASEPSMEEILASIRLIISDDAKKAPSDRQDLRAAQPATLKNNDALAAAPDEEVFDLTEELVFPEEQPAPTPVAPVIAAHPAAAPLSEAPPEIKEEAMVAQEEPSAQEQAAESGLEPSPAVETEQDPIAKTDYPTRQESAPEPRSEPVYRPAPAPSRTIWSRRELPGSPPASARPRTPSEPSPARGALRSWAEDIQMPIPDRGPVPLIEPGETQAQIQAPMDEPSHAAALREVHGAEALGEKEEAAVSALAESLARSAASAMDEEELETARDVNFARLHDEHKSEVAESFTKAIERESASRERGPLPTLFDEVFREGFASEPSIAEPTLEREAAETAAATFAHEEAAHSEHEFEAPARAEFSEAQQADDKWPFFSAREAPSAPEQPAEPPKPEKHVAQAQFVGTSQIPSAPAPEESHTLEGAVREMLRPMLKQWLNDNMPRILETAIREEISTRGLLPKVDR